MSEVSDDFSLDVCVRVLDEFKSTIEEASNRKELVSTICEHFIPFLKRHPLFISIISSWEDGKKRLNDKLIKCEKNAFKEAKQVFKEIKKKLQTEDLSDYLKAKIQEIDNLIQGKIKYSHPPIYRAIYNMLRELIITLVDSGYEEVCKKYSILSYKKEYNFENGKTQLITKTYIEKFTFAPSVWEAVDVLKEMNWNNTHDPIIAWWYLEAAHQLWNTPEKNFDKSELNKFQKEPINHFELACYKNSWWEINAIKNNYQSDHRQIVIFSDDLFRKGFKTLYNAIIAHFALKITGASEDKLQKPLFCIELEMILDGNELSIARMEDNREKERFFLKQFHHGRRPSQFIQFLFKHPEGGKLEFDFEKNESISKFIERIGFTPDLRKLFFEKSSKPFINFKGTKIQLFDKDKLILLEHL